MLKKIVNYASVAFIVTAIVTTIVNIEHKVELAELVAQHDCIVNELRAESDALNSELTEVIAELDKTNYAYDDLWDDFKEAEWAIYCKDKLMVENGVQPYELDPCYRCGSPMVLAVDYDEDVFYLGCTSCDMYGGSFANAQDAAIYWNMEE